MRKNKMILLAMMVLPWLSLPLLGKRSFKRFYPGALFISVWVAVESIVAKKRMWWRIYERIIPKVIGEMPFILGPFFVATLWIFKLTYGNFLKFFTTNAVLDVICAYPFAEVWEKVGVFKLKKLSHTMWYVFCISLAVIIYGFQKIVEKTIREPNGPGSKS